MFSFLIVFFVLSIFVMVCSRPIFLRLMFKDKSSLKVVNKPIYAALYFFPLLIITHITAGGVLCKHKQKLNFSFSKNYFFFKLNLDYSFPILMIVFFLISNAFYLCKEFKENQQHNSSIKLAFVLFKKPRHLFLILAHWYFYAFSLIAIIEFKLFFLNYYYLLFVPTPLLFFVVSYKHTDPKNFIN